MLILSRKAGEKIVIRTPSGEKIAVTLMEIDRRCGKIRLGFDAEKDISIYREEIDEIKFGAGVAQPEADPFLPKKIA